MNEDNIFKVVRDNPSIQPDVIFNIGNIPVTNSFLMSVLVLFILLSIIIFVNINIKKDFNKKISIVESMFEALSDWFFKIAGTKRNLDRILAITATLFVFILVSNFIGIIPGLTAITFDDKSLFRSPTNDFNTTFSIALAVLLIIQLESIRDFGLFGYIGRFVKLKEVVEGFKGGIGKGFMSLIDLFIGLMDIVSEIAKVVSLSLRLFGNLYAGEVLATILAGVLAYGLPSVWGIMSSLSGFIQAIVFSSLVAVYYVGSVKSREDKVN